MEPGLGRVTHGSREKASSTALAVVSCISPRLVEWDGRVRLPYPELLDEDVDPRVLCGETVL